MKNKEILKIIQENSYAKFNEFIMSGADYNQLIYGKSLLHHALLYNSNQCINLLLLYGAEPIDLRHIDNWKERLSNNDPAFVEMVSEIETATVQGENAGQIILNFMAGEYFKDKTLSYRNIMSYVDKSFYELKVGLHIFEIRDSNYIFETMPGMLGCNFDFKETR